MDTNVVAVRPRQTLIHAADNHGVAQSGPPQPKFSPRITRMNAKKNFGSKSREPASPRKLSGLQPNPQYPRSGAAGSSDTEGKAVRVAASERGSERVSTPRSFPFYSCLRLANSGEGRVDCRARSTTSDANRQPRYSF